jgi:hypothetical protein
MLFFNSPAVPLFRGFVVAQYLDGGNPFKIISVGPADCSSTPDSDAMNCPCTIFSESEGQYYKNDMKMSVTPVSG